jgi:hypothetical protein
VEALAQRARVSRHQSTTDPIPDFSFGDRPAIDPSEETAFPEPPDIPSTPDDAGAPMTLPKRIDIEGVDEYAEAAGLQETHPEALATEELALEALALEALALQELAQEDPAMDESALDDLVDTIVLIEAGDDAEAEGVELEPEMNEAVLNLMQARFQSALDAGAHTIAEDQPGNLLDMLA